MIKIPVVGNRGGRAVVIWWGVFAVTLIVLATWFTGAWLMYLALGSGFPMTTMVILGVSQALAFVGFSVRRALHTPLESLPRLD